VQSAVLRSHVVRPSVTRAHRAVIFAIAQLSCYLLQVEAEVEGSNSVPAIAGLEIVVKFNNDHAPLVTVDTYTDSGEAEVRADAPNGTFIAHISASDDDGGTNGEVSCRLDSYRDDFRLVRISGGDYKLVTERAFDVVGVVVVTVSCQDHGDPPLTTSTDINVTITAVQDADSPVFTQSVYNATLSVASRAPVFVIRVNATAPSGSSGVYYSFVESYPEFAIGRTTGVVRMLAVLSETTAVELTVTAGMPGGGNSNTTVYVSLVKPEEVLFFNRTPVCSVSEDADPGTRVCSLADTEILGVSSLYYDLADAADSQFRVDPISGVVYTNATLDREQTSQFTLSARVQLDVLPTRVENILFKVTVEDVNDCVPQFIFPSPGNDTVRVDTVTEWSSTSRGLFHVAVVSASDCDASENGRVTYSIIANNSDSRNFVVESATGEVHLNVVDGLTDLISWSFELYIAATDQGRPPLQSVATLHIIILPAGTPTSSSYSKEPSDSELTVLAAVPSSFVFVVLVIGIAVVIVVCRKSKRRKAKPPITGDLFWGRVLSDSPDMDRATASAPVIGSEPTTNGLDKPFHLSNLTVDTGLDYLQRYKVCIKKFHVA